MFELLKRLLNENKKIFIGTCVDNPFSSEDELSNVIDNAVSIRQEEFLENADVDEKLLEEIERYPNDFEFYKSGNVYYFTHSAIEHFFK
jgi:hypothetical protein